MKTAFRCICLLLIMSIILTIPVHAEEPSTRASNYFSSLQTYICDINGTQFSIYFGVTGTRRMEKIGASQIEIQRSVNNATWTTVATYTPEDYPQMIESNTASCVGSVSYTGSMDDDYRAYVTFYAENSSGWAEMYR